MLAKMGQKTVQEPHAFVIGGSVVVPVDLTSPWIPLSLIMVLGIFMVRQFVQERREARALAFAESSGAAPSTQVEAAAPAPAVEPVAAPAAIPEKKKMKLRWRTAWIWLPFLAGFFGQAYLSFIKPMLDNAG